MREIVSSGAAESAHDVSDGGLAVALAECCMGGTGAALAIESPLTREIGLFHEGPSRIVVSTANPGAVEEIAGRHGVAAARVGITMNRALAIDWNGSPVAALPVEEIRRIYENSLETQLRS